MFLETVLEHGNTLPATNNKPEDEDGAGRMEAPSYSTIAEMFMRAKSIDGLIIIEESTTI